jgi:hypothetical protein
MLLLFSPGGSLSHEKSSLNEDEPSVNTITEEEMEAQMLIQKKQKDHCQCPMQSPMILVTQEE